MQGRATQLHDMWRFDRDSQASATVAEVENAGEAFLDFTSH